MINRLSLTSWYFSDEETATEASRSLCAQGRTAALSGLILENPLLMPYVCTAAASQMGGINIHADLDGNGGKGKGNNELVNECGGCQSMVKGVVVKGLQKELVHYL